jgi:hypothetical protein
VKFFTQDEENKMAAKKYALFVLSLFLLPLAGHTQDKIDGVTPGQTQEIAPESEKRDVETYTKLIEAQNRELLQKTQEMTALSEDPDRDDLPKVKKLSSEIYALTEEIAKLQIGQHESLLAAPELTESRRLALQENQSILQESIQLIQQVKPLTDELFAESEKTSPDIKKIEDLQKKMFPLANRLQEVGLKVQHNLMVP